MDFLSLFPILIVLLYFLIIGSVLYLIYKWVSRFIHLREQQNELLREIIRKMDK